MRAAAGDAGASWDLLVDADAQPRGGPHFQALQRLVGRAVAVLDRRVRAADGVIVATGVGLIVRYGALDVVERWRDDLTRSAATNGTALRGLVLVVPGRDRDQRPEVDGTPIPVVTAGQWTRIPTAWLDRPTP